MSEHHEAINYFVDSWETVFQAKYNFSKTKEPMMIKRLLTLYGLEIYKQLVDQFFVSTDEWINKTSRSIGVFSVSTNKMMREIKQRNISLSKRGHQNLTAAARWLQKRGTSEGDRGQDRVRKDVDKTSDIIQQRTRRTDDRCVLRGSEPLRIGAVVESVVSNIDSQD